jgi:hypothetical protein
MLPVGDSVVSGLAVTHDSDGQQPGNVRTVLATPDPYYITRFQKIMKIILI